MTELLLLTKKSLKQLLLSKKFAMFLPMTRMLSLITSKMYSTTLHAMYSKKIIDPNGVSLLKLIFKQFISTGTVSHFWESILSLPVKKPKTK